jgi:adenosylhomocysteine nucleosidase
LFRPWQNHVAMTRTPHTVAPADDALQFVVLVSADAEWRAVAELFAGSGMERTPYGEFFSHRCGASRGVVMHGGWGKIDAAASTQYAISRWRPPVVVNLGTCGGIQGQIERFETVLAERTVVYDITERMGDSAEAIRGYATAIDLDWLGSGPLPSPVRRSLLVSADRDLAPADIPLLRRLYHASAVDWESGAIARVASRNNTRVLILRGVSDLVSEESDSEFYENPELFEAGSLRIMRHLFDVLPVWIEAAVQTSARVSGRGDVPGREAEDPLIPETARGTRRRD